MKNKPVSAVRAGRPPMGSVRNHLDRPVQLVGEVRGGGLRSRYQSRAWSYSASASSWKSTGLAAMSKLGRNTAAELVPGNGFCFAGIEICDAASNLVVPRRFDGRGIFLDGFQAFEQGVCQLNTLFDGKGKGLF